MSSSSRLLAGLVALLLAGCPPDPPPQPEDPCARVVQGVDPAPLIRPPLERWPLLELDDWPTPRGPWQGGGRAWQAKVGASGFDYPGPAALIAPPGHPGAQLTLLTPDELAGSACDHRPGPSDWLGVATELVDCAGEEACWEQAERLLDAGASLLLVRTPAGEGESAASLAPRLGWRVRERVDHRGVLHHLGVAAPATSKGLLQRSEQAHLVVLEGPAVDLFEDGRLRLLDSVVRATGRRPLLRWPFTSADPDLPDSDERDLVLMGLHLALGGGLLVDGSDPLPTRLEHARAWLRRRPELVHRSSAALQFYFDPSLAGDELPAELGRALDAAHVPWEVAVRPAAGLDDTTLELERLHNAPLVALSDPGALPELVRAMPGGVFVPHLVSPEREPCRDALAAAARAAGGQALALPADGASSAPRVEAARIDTDLPATVQIVRTAAPHRGLVVHHLLNRAFDAAGAPRPAPARRLVTRARPGLGARSRCEAVWHLPAEGRSEPLDCSVLEGDRVAVELPSFETWAVVTTRLHPEERGWAFGERRIRIQSPGRSWSGTTASLEVPFLSTELATTLSLPEWLRPAGGEMVDFGAMEHRHDVDADGSRARLVSEGEGIRFERELRAGLDRLDLRLTVTNLGEQPLADVEALVCVATTGGSPFPESGHAGTWILDSDRVRVLGEVPADNGDPLYREDMLPRVGEAVAPLTILRSVDDRYSLGTGFETSDVVGGNGATGGVCQHARPRFGDLAPGASATRRGVVWLSPDEPARIARRWVREFGEPTPAPATEVFAASRPVCP